MKVGTDSILLGALCDCPNPQSALDIGTGCGILALMAAQKTTAQITALDLDLPSIEEASHNFRHSRWSSRLSVVNQGLEEFTTSTDALFDLIITNPPYFEEHTHAPSDQRNRARNNVSLPFDTLAQCVVKLLSQTGEFWLILPVSQHQRFAFAATPLLLNCSKRIEISHKEGDPPTLVISKWKHLDLSAIHTLEKLAIYDQQHHYSAKFKAATLDFYPFF